MSPSLKRAGRNLDEALSELYPGYFALAMATGIVSVAAYLLELRRVAWLLLWINEAAYIVLWLLMLLRLVRHFRLVVRDLTDHTRGPGFFTLVAATCVLGSQFVILERDYATARFLWWLGLALWLTVTYSFFAAVTVRERKPGIEAGLNGAWLIAIVATQSVSILSALIAPSVDRGQDVLRFFALAMYLFGGMLYILIIVLIFYRFTFYTFDPANLTPPYWINMGAVAITTLAGATLLLGAREWGFLAELSPFLKGFTLFFWATGTWWIPLLLILGAWRHLVRRFPLRYDPQYWGMIFPLGMYTACTFQLARATELPFLVPIASSFVYIAIGAWSVTFLGLLHSLLSLGRVVYQAATTSLRRVTFFCPYARRAVSVVFVERETFRERRAVDVAACSAFDDPNAPTCSKQCLQVAPKPETLDTAVSAGTGVSPAS